MNHPIKKENMLELARYQQHLCTFPRLKYLFLELTDRCNLSCRHCGSSCTANNHTYLPFEKIQEVLLQVAEAYDARDIMICITGGEPFLHPDIYDIIRYARKCGFAAGVTSNGTLIDEEAARAAVSGGLNTIAISIDGLADSHDDFRNQVGSFDKAMQGIRNLRMSGADPQIITVVHPGNINTLQAMFEFFREEKISSWRLVNVDPIGRAKRDSGILLSGNEMKTLLNFIRGKRFDPDNEMEVTYGCSHFVTFEYEREIRDYYFQCIAGTQVASIMANGDIGACLDIERRPELIQGNVYRDNFIDVWENRFSVFRNDRSERSSECLKCEERNVCRGDSAHTWDYDNDAPLYCVRKLLEG